MGLVTVKTTLSPLQKVSLMASDTRVADVGATTVRVIESVVEGHASGSILPPSRGRS